MNAFTRLSGKGQVVVPKAVRDRLGWRTGLDLEVVEAGNSITLRPRRSEGHLSIDEAVARFRRIYQHDGPPVPLERLGWSADAEDEA
ncbi:AbrB family looped-hinge helix DNA binding protein [Sphingomonas sp. BE138]|uniref:AbrB/MazE/SpoVT family DNA-binding domain-containing protein n=1 Tax=Sphingomonas sp. BE138 TaxID=2817845 RepID=UPI0028624D65|nr:AbrB/MazE/SpoVT family DNA-binding domain-containing protein [Sphingomonas sp. BE138]MDR6789666.1 AbrB family looped-hinge helix DNA binding protein [Sphingomonas sp. BE138]